MGEPVRLTTGSFFESVFNRAAQEIQRARDLAKKNFFTEAGVRTGRATEAALYELAQVAGTSLTDRNIREIEKVRGQLLECEVKILREQTSHTVKLLASVSKSLSEAIATLSETDESRSGVAKNEPRNLDSLFNEVIISTQDNGLIKRLKSQKPVLRGILDARNKAAHADVAGEIRELSKKEYLEISDAAEQFLNKLAELYIGLEAANRLKPSQRGADTQPS